MYRKIIVGYDGSERAQDGLALGKLIAEASGADLVVAGVFQFDPRWGGLDPNFHEADANYAREIERAAASVGAESEAIPSSSAPTWWSWASRTTAGRDRSSPATWGLERGGEGFQPSVPQGRASSAFALEALASRVPAWVIAGRRDRTRSPVSSGQRSHRPRLPERRGSLGHKAIARRVAI